MQNGNTKIVEIPVLGLDGSSSGQDLVRRLSAIHGLDDVRVDSGTRRIIFRLTNGGGPNGQLGRALEEIKKSGLELPISREEVDIYNLRCAACVNTLEKGLKNIPGIAGARINFATQTGQIDLIDGMYDRRQLISDIKNIGYEADFHLDDKAELIEENGSRRDLMVSLLCTGAIFALHFGQHILGLFTVRPGAMALVQLALTLPVLYAGRAFFADAYLQLRRFRANMNTLVSLGAGTALIYSLVNTAAILSGRISGHAAIYYETTAMIITFILIGRYLEKRATHEARDAARGMATLIPQTAVRLNSGGEEAEVAVADLQVGDTLLVRPGKSIPADGVIVEGETTVDESMFTGESVPVAKKVADKVTGGTLNIGNGIKMKVTQVGRGTVLARVIRMVRDAQSEKAPIQRVADRVAAKFVPIVILIALITLILWALFDPGSDMVLIAPVAVLLVACPCAMGLATPTAVLVGTGRAARLGVLFRNGEILERLSRVTTYVFDKTGTLTDGRPVVDRIIPAEGTTAETLLQYAAAAEKYSEHPFAAALIRRARREELKLPGIDAHEIKPGRGLTAEVGGRKVVVGSKSYVADSGLAPESQEMMKSLEKSEQAAVVHVALDGNYLGAITFTDTIKTGAVETIEWLREAGRETIMLTGDNNYSAATMAARLKIETFEAEARPENKLVTIQSLSRTGRVTAMVGDGVNDAASLAAAEIGIALGTGTDIAIKASDITITGKSLSAILTAIEVSRATLKIIKQNLFWAFFYNIIMIPVAAGILYPGLGITLSPALAAAAMAMSSVFVVTNSLRLKKLQPAHENPPTE